MKTRSFGCGLAAVLLAWSVNARAADQPQPPNTLTAAEQQAGWRLLFDGKTTEGWRGYQLQTMPPGWTVIDDALVRVSGGAGGKGAGGGDDIVTTEEFENFDFEIEWKVRKQGNSGVLYHVSEEPVTSWHDAPEVQILDNSAYPTRDKRQHAGACYDLYAPTKDATRPVGEWNRMRILVNGAHVEHWMNGEKIVEYELWSDDWNQRVAGSKHKDHPQFGAFKKGPICLQDHTDRIEFRNIKIRPLPAREVTSRAVAPPAFPQDVIDAAAPPAFPQDVIDAAFAEPLHQSQSPIKRERPTQKSRQAAIMLALVARLHPDAKSSSGALVRERVATQIHEFLKPGHDARNNGIQGAGFDALANHAILALARHTPTVWNLVSADDRNRADWYMRMAAVVGNRKHNEANRCHTSFGLDGGGGSNPNQRPDMRSMSYVWIYFGSADAVNAELAAFDYDKYLAQFQAFGWESNVTEWTKPNVRTITEKGGTFGNSTVNPDGARRAFKVVRGRVAGPPLDRPTWGYAKDDQLLPYTPVNVFRREEYDFNMGAQVVDKSYSPNPKNNEHGRLLSGAPSPHLGQVGMFLEYNIGQRSSPSYVTMGAHLSIVHYAVLAALGFWDSGNPAYDEMADRFRLAMDDARYKNEHGWFDNVPAYNGPRTAFSPSQGGRYILAIWDTMFPDQSIVWEHNPVTAAREM